MGQIEIYHSPSYINELLIERNSSYNLHGKHTLSIPTVQSTKYGLHSFHYSVSYIGICSQRYLELLSHYMFSNKKLRALALIINAAPL